MQQSEMYFLFDSHQQYYDGQNSATFALQDIGGSVEKYLSYYQKSLGKKKLFELSYLDVEMNTHVNDDPQVSPNCTREIKEPTIKSPRI